MWVFLGCASAAQPHKPFISVVVWSWLSPTRTGHIFVIQSKVISSNNGIVLPMLNIQVLLESYSSSTQCAPLNYSLCFYPTCIQLEYIQYYRAQWVGLLSEVAFITMRFSIHNCVKLIKYLVKMQMHGYKNVISERFSFHCVGQYTRRNCSHF